MFRLRLCVFLLVLTSSLTTSTKDEGPRLQVSSLTIKLAASEDKDGPTFTGTYPSTVLAEQEVTLDTHIMVTFKISSVDSKEESILPQQRLVMFQSKSKDVAKYIIAKKQKEKVIGTLQVSDIVDQLGRMEAFEVVVMVGDPKYEDGVIWNLGGLKLKPGSISKELLEPPLPLRLQQPQQLPEITHIFRESQKRPPAALSLFFSVLCLAPLGLFLITVRGLGLNTMGMPTGASKSLMVIFHTGVLGILCLYTIFFLKLNLVQIIIPLLCLALMCFASGHHTLCAVAGTATKEKVA